MIVTVIVVLYTHDLSKGVFAGYLSMIFFSAKISKVSVEKNSGQPGSANHLSDKRPGVFCIGPRLHFEV